MRLTVVRHGLPLPPAAADERVISTEDLKAWIRSGRIATQLFRWHEARLLTDRLNALGRPLPAAMALRMLSRTTPYAEDAAGHRRPLTTALLGRWVTSAAREPFERGSLVASAEAGVARLEAEVGHGPAALPVRRDVSPLYVRADVSFGVKAGGSVGHTAGIINHLGHVAARPIVVSTDRLPMLDSGVELHEVAPDEAFWNYRELPAIVMNGAVRRTTDKALAGRPIGFVYQRYTTYGFAALEVARQHNVPLITEYNGSEVWVARHWGRPLRYEALARRIEHLNLRGAQLVSVVSRPLADEVERAGVSRNRILVNPNGVDPDVYHPAVDASGVRTRYALEGRTVVGFIGTFGPWHGAEVLAEALVQLFRAQPSLRASVRALFIGDGVGLPDVRAIVERGGIGACCVFTGLVPQADGPAHLAACDVLVSPHVPNADGSPFFGSPTKLFEYMAMGRGIVASDLDQIGEVLEHERTALLVPPRDVEALASAMRRLIESRQLRERLGQQARERVLEQHTWREHVRRTVDALEQVR
jgi:glycosyltransferase involved in cell wall biosynthesis